MTPGKVASVLLELVAKVADLEASHCKHVHDRCEVCAADREVADRVARRRRLADALTEGPSAFFNMLESVARELLLEAREESVIDLVGRCATHAEQDQLLGLVKQDVRYRAALYHSELPSWIELMPRPAREEPEHQDGRGRAGFVSTTDDFLERTFSIRNFDPAFGELLRDLGVEIDHEGRGKRPCLACEHRTHPHPRTMRRDLFDAWTFMDKSFKRACQLDLDVRELSHDEAYRQELTQPPRAVRLPRRAI